MSGSAGSSGPISVQQQALSSLASSLSKLAGDLTPVAAALSQWGAGSTSIKNPAAAAAFERVRTVWTKELSGQASFLESLSGGVNAAGNSYVNNDGSVAGSIDQLLLGGLSDTGNVLARPPAGPSGPGK